MMTKKIASGKPTLMQRGKKTTLQILAACGFLMGAGMMQSCEKDILTGQPVWLGNSIYERLQEGVDLTDGTHQTFNYTVRLIQDLDKETAGKEGAYDYVNTLSQTGSKTLFVATDAAYEEYFKEKGITYDDLTTEQKKQLFNGSMINNAYILELMSNTSGNPPQQGECMRRLTASSIYDNVPTMTVAEFPQNEEMPGDKVNSAWAALREAGSDIKILKDATPAPMIHFLPKFMQKKNVLSEDLEIISNHVSKSVDDSWINGKKVLSYINSNGEESLEMTCKNGYIYVIDGVSDNNMNMAEIIHSKPELSGWSHFLKRWSVPVLADNSIQVQYQRLNNTTSLLYNLRYLNMSENHGWALAAVGDTATTSEILKYDPGWNRYTASGNSEEGDAGAMFVPSDDILDEWFANGPGAALIKNFGSRDQIPLTTLSSLINVNMMESFTASVPSKFTMSVLDEAGRPLQIEPSDVSHCYMGCNGVVYVVKKVFAPAKYSSVIYPVLIQGDTKTEGAGTSFNAIYHAIVADYDPRYDASTVRKDKLPYDFQPYLMSMDSRFTLVVPYNKAQSENPDFTGGVIRYLDPCSYGMPQQNLMEFYFDKNTVKGYNYKCKVDENGNITEIGNPTTIANAATIGKNIITNRLTDYLDNAIIVEDLDPSKEYYKTKAGSVIRSFMQNGKQCFQGGYQLETGEVIKVSEADTYHMDGTSSKGNGSTYGTNSCTDADALYLDLPLTASKSVYQLLEQRKKEQKDSIFWKLIFEDLSADADNYIDLELVPKGVSSALFSPTLSGTTYKCAAQTAGNMNMSVFDNYNYTVYVPSDKVLRILTGIDATEADKQDSRYLSIPTWEDFKAATTNDEKIYIANRIHDFVRYHIQDNSVFVNSGNVNTTYETGMLNTANKRFYTLGVKANASSLTVTDVLGNSYNVRSDFSNKPVREYWIDGTLGATTGSAPAMIKSSSNAVVHMIDGALYFKSTQKMDWRSAMKYGY